MDKNKIFNLFLIATIATTPLTSLHAQDNNSSWFSWKTLTAATVVATSCLSLGLGYWGFNQKKRADRLEKEKATVISKKDAAVTGKKAAEEMIKEVTKEIEKVTEEKNAAINRLNDLRIPQLHNTNIDLRGQAGAIYRAYTLYTSSSQKNSNQQKRKTRLKDLLTKIEALEPLIDKSKEMHPALAPSAASSQSAAASPLAPSASSSQSQGSNSASVSSSPEQIKTTLGVRDSHSSTQSAPAGTRRASAAAQSDNGNSSTSATSTSIS